MNEELTLSINACCRFCGKADMKSIQVICEGKCLVCSRCQLIGSIRSLFIDHSFFETIPGIVNGNKIIDLNCSFKILVSFRFYVRKWFVSALWEKLNYRDEKYNSIYKNFISPGKQFCWWNCKLLMFIIQYTKLW